MNNIEEIVMKCVSYLNNRGVLTLQDDSVLLRDDHNDDLVFFARSSQDMLESYFIVLDVIEKLHKKKILNKDIILDIRKNGLKLFHLGRIKLPESLSMPTYKSALQKFTDDEFIVEESVGKKSSLYFTKDQVTPRKIRETIEIFLSTLG